MSPQQYTVWNKQSKTKAIRPLPTLPYLPPSVRRIKSNTAALGIEKGKKALQEKSEQILLTHKSIPAHNYCVQSVRLVLNIAKKKKTLENSSIYQSDKTELRQTYQDGRTYQHPSTLKDSN